LHHSSGGVCVSRFGASDDRHEDQHGKSLVRLDSHLEYHSDAEHRQEAYLWIVLFLIPLVNIVFIILVWMGIAEARNKPNWWGILIIVPVANIIVPGYLAWAD
jgi:hypothetical protein